MKLSLPLAVVWRSCNAQPASWSAFGVVLVTLLPTLLFSTLPATAAPTLPPNSFLRAPVTSLQGLIREITDDSIVANRYARLLHMSPEMVRVTFAGLHLTRLPEERSLQIWGIGLNRPEQPLIARVRRVVKGEPIFALPDNTPVLLVRCGNPVRLVGPSGPTVSLSAIPLWQPYATVPDAPVGPDETDFALPTVSPSDHLIAIDLLMPPTEEATGPIAFVPSSDTPTDLSGGEAPAGFPLSTGGGGNLSSWLAPLPLLAALGDFGGRGNGSSAAYHAPLPGPLAVPEGGLKSLMGAISLLAIGFIMRRAVSLRGRRNRRTGQEALTAATSRRTGSSSWQGGRR